jgi:hypothetical protein
MPGRRPLDGPPALGERTSSTPGPRLPHETTRSTPGPRWPDETTRSTPRARSGGQSTRSTPHARSLGQSTVEVVGMLPVLAIVAFAALQILAAGLAAELADHAAEAGAVAILEGTDPQDAAKHAIPGWSGAHVDVAVHGKTVRVRVRPPAVVRSVGNLLASTAEAKAAPR